MPVRESHIPRFSVNRPVTVAMCLIALLAIGAVAYARIPVQLFPSGFTPSFLFVRVGLRNASPREVEQQIAKPLEESLSTVRGVKRIRTRSSGGGVSAPIEFRSGTDMDAAYNQVFDRLQRLLPSLPEESREGLRIYKFNFDQISALWIGLNYDGEIEDPYRFLDTHVRQRLLRLEGVAKVDLHGIDEKEVMIEIDQDRLAARGMTVGEVVQALRSDNIALAGGRLKEGGKNLYVRSLARFKDLDAMKRLTLSGSGGVRLNEVATVAYDVPERKSFQRINGRKAISFEVFQESNANIVDVCERVVGVLEDIEANQRGHRLQFDIFANQGRFITESVGNLRNTGLWGGLFAAFVLLFFLRTLRMTTIITLAIPLCVMITISALYFIGWSLNMLTMMGLMVGVGLVVDNAIVILENIYRFRRKGHEPKRAAVLGASEVGLAITMATLTTVVVFLPLILMSGDMQATFFLARMGIPVVTALLASLFVALIFIPIASVRIGGSMAASDDPAIIARIRRVYEHALLWTISHRRDALLVALVMMVSIAIPASGLKRASSGGSGLNEFRIRFYPASNFTVEQTNRVITEAEQFLDERRERYGIRTMRVYYRATYGQIQIFLESQANEPWWYVVYRDTRDLVGVPMAAALPRKEVIGDLKKNLPGFVGVRTAVDRGGESASDPSISVGLHGPDTEMLARLSEEVMRRLRTIPSIVSVDTDHERADDEVRLRIDRERASQFGISPEAVGRSVAFALQGVSLDRFQTRARDVTMRLYLEEQDRQTLHQLKNFTFRSRSGEQVPLSEIAGVEVAGGSGTIHRENRKSRIRIQAFTTKDDIKGLYQEIDIALKGFSLPRGYSWDKGEKYSTMQEEDSTMAFAGLMAITCVFLLMGVLFESFILPFSVILSIPLAFLGVMWTLYLTGTPMDFMAMMGCIILIGVVVNNAIVLVDMVNRLRTEGYDRAEAIIEAGRNRFRPIMMTTFTTVFGLLPMAVGNSAMMGTPYAPLGRTMMGGLICSTALTLLVVPLFYTFLDDMRCFLRRVTVSAIGKRRTPTLAS
jgi:hydrophobic/amphiphilic exporter-1 (mainly G- bacteria), HAE1 family